MASSPTLKEPTGSTAGGAQKWGGPDAVHCAELIKGTHSTEKVQPVAIDSLEKVITAFKGPVRVVSTANINLASASDPSPVDGVTLANGNRILLKDQTAGLENGIYDCVTATNPTTWIRSTDFDSNSDIASGLLVSVSEGTVGADTLWQLTTNGTLVLDTTALVITEFLVTELTKLAGISVGAEVNPDLISQAEAETGSATTERIFSALRVRQAANAARKEVQIILLDATVAAVVGNDVGAVLFNIGSLLAGMNLVSAEAVVATAGTTGTLDIMVRNKTQTQDMLTLKIQVASGAILSDNGETINAATDDVVLNDQIAIDIDVIHTTPSLGLTIILGFEKP